ncbi:MAG TPA: glycine cleavage system protein GcvH [Gammaproteobacteria bacterium]|uniref:Glycine cleavage system H protein n=1 Tax=OM182 bacterium TaxID=2510334 RepID=A0A520S7B1_9GAMM|nr:glycine cleavage system protein H [Gammaproteobacteria bacterium]OUX32626.1 MAG: glycine cleavage system protein H [Gammaproteobacteria bacterium TMED260]RZO78334.1 MAG: glycine cleavage system protein GcvH [OM182 bacterium]HAR90823.1 glycine cleavage system protein GcvH [Gammaproteobacteria bacterium]HAU23370.1 glycine cleavage system protein GcvH [Gammaproteobacteria bacterium]
MSKIIDDLKYAASHEWVSVDDNGIATVGISDHAQEALGDIVFVELPEPGTTVNAKDEVSVVESVKAASDVYSPVSGEITEINEALLDAPETVNASPYDNGWFFKIAISEEADLDELMDAEAYSDHCDDE